MHQKADEAHYPGESWDSGKASEGRYIGGVRDKSAPTDS